MSKPKSFFFDSLGSTQDWVKEHAASLPHFSWVQALSQTQARGRRGYAWVSPPGSLYLTLWLPLPLEAHLTWMPLAFSLWIAAYIEEKIQVSLQVKWPNDLWLDGKKCGGILCERVSLGFLVGIGLNLQDPSGLPQATSLSTQLTPDLIRVFGTNIALYLIHCYQKPSNPGLWREQYLKRAIFQPGDLIRYKEKGSSFQGKVLGLGPLGTLEVESGGEKKELYAAEVHLLRGLA
jgi:BirA family transcriptional regulator, biotin operon repressor / biotin---[acetyl-CoA-carboxylase] ligase